MKEFRLIRSRPELEDAAAILKGSALLAVDTEFFRERTYFARLCLIQVAGDEAIACIDCIDGPDNDAVADVLFRDDVVWLLHSARQDLEVIGQKFGRLPAKLIDTQVAAALAGFAPQISLQEIVSKMLGVELEKGHTRTNWSRRPLADEALEYALDDVRYLPALYVRLAERLEELGRGDWLVQDCARLLETPLEPDPVSLFTRLKGGGGLRGDAAAAALALLQWREARAKKADRPRRWIMSDEALVRIARSRPDSPRELQNIDGLPSGAVSRSGKDIVEAVAQSKSSELQALVGKLPTQARPDPAAIKAAKQELQAVAEKLAIEADVIATRRDLTSCVLGEPPSHLVDGWRSGVLDIGQLKLRAGS